MVTESPVIKTKKKRERSPSYPGIDLREAIERARQIYSEEKKYAASMNTIFAHWGYSPNSSDGFVVLSALKKFGLLIDEGSGDKRKARLTDEAVAILVDDREDSPGRLKLIQKAALKPSIHQELWDKYGAQLPSDANLKYELRTERHFSERGAKEFMEHYKHTIQFAKLTESDKLSEESGDKKEERHVPPPGSITATKEREAKPDQKSRRVVALPIGQEWAVLEATFPITEDEWKQMIAVLNAMKPGLVKE